MIFATVGTQLAFPRLMTALNELAPSLGEPVIAQMGEDRHEYPALDVRRSMTPRDYEDTFRAARIVVAHAGMGSILSARRLEKPLVILPRRHALGEHRNDHQMATALRFSNLPGVHVIWEVEDLGPILRGETPEAARETVSDNLEALIGAVRGYIEA